jgi:phosphoribosylaminoimidazole-succinocarboxamide synthase
MSDTLSHLHEASGKVRELYGFGDRLLMVASDRISAFDVVLPTPIPDKGRVLTALSRFWFERTIGIVPNHLISMDVADFPAEAQGIPDLAGRSMLVHRLTMLRIGVRASAAERPARGRQAARAPVHAVDQGHRGARHEHRP